MRGENTETGVNEVIKKRKRRRADYIRHRGSGVFFNSSLKSEMSPGA